VAPKRILRALLVDVGPARREEILDALARAGWSVQAEPVAGTDALSAALARRGWDVVIYAADGPDAIPARKAMALVRMADPQLAFVAAVASARPGDLSAFVQGFGPETIFAPDPARLPEVLEQVLAAAHEALPDADGAHRLLLAQQAITDHIAAGLAPDELSARVLATLGETLGWAYGAVWRPAGEPSVLRCSAVWHHAAAGPEVAAFAAASRRADIAPGRGLPGRAYAFRRRVWVGDVAADGNTPRHARALRAGLGSAVAFPIALADDCAGAIEFFSGAIEQPDAQIAAMFATVGGQLAQYLERRRLQADESRRVEATLRAERDRARHYLDVAGTMIVVLGLDGEILLVNRAGRAVLARPEDELLGASWFDVALPAHERAVARARYRELMQGGGPLRERCRSSVLGGAGLLRSIAWRNTVLRDADGAIAGMVCSGEDVTERLQAERAIRRPA
jgi:PAS domain S-box-containing protein